ncbi:hypothetical protein IFO70_32740 [Phormidium tenue FACHB-886]|nr:hypothetical protein [Phormidium tenue FACHB-886]
MWNPFKRNDVIRIQIVSGEPTQIEWTPEELAEMDAEFDEYNARLDAEMAEHRAELERIGNGDYDLDFDFD